MDSRHGRLWQEESRHGGGGRRFVAGLKRCFAELHDPRVQGRCAHLLIDILAISLLAVMCGAEDWPDIAAVGRNFAGTESSTVETLDRGHGREEFRSYEVLEIPADHPQRAVWKDLRSLVVVTSCRTVDGEDPWETRKYVTSHAPEAKPLAKAIRRHWGIENTQHWTLDVTFGEDPRRQQDRHGAANLAAVRRLALSLLRQEKTNRRGVKNKRFTCALDAKYLLTVLNNAKF